MSYVFSYNKLSEKLGKQYHLQLHQKDKIPRNKFNQGGEKFVTENSETLVKEVKEDINKQKDTLCSWITRINIV